MARGRTSSPSNWIAAGTQKKRRVTEPAVPFRAARGFAAIDTTNLRRPWCGVPKSAKRTGGRTFDTGWVFFRANTRPGVPWSFLKELW